MLLGASMLLLGQPGKRDSGMLQLRCYAQGHVSVIMMFRKVAPGDFKS
jgi:hypothetical protein